MKCEFAGDSCRIAAEWGLLFQRIVKGAYGYVLSCQFASHVETRYFIDHES